MSIRFYLSKLRKYAVFITVILFALSMTACSYSVTEFNSLKDYGVITGHGAGHRAREMFAEIFPKQIEEFFSEANYHYKSVNGADARSYEISLEIMIEDSAAFRNYIQNISAGKQQSVFLYDETYCCYSISTPWIRLDSKTPCDNCEGEPIHYHIDSADIEMILVQPDTHRIIFVAMGVFDGGGVSTADLHWFFDRFNIDPLVYAAENK